jgi:hypothetical protein
MTTSSGGSGRRRGRRTRLGWREDDLRNAFRALNDGSGTFRGMVNAIDEDRWVSYHQLSDAALSRRNIADELSIDLNTVVALESPRRCLEKYDHDYDKVQRCLDGEEPD